MSLRDMGAQLGHQNKDTLIGAIRFLAHEREPIEKYEDRLTDDTQLKNDSTNEKNLFDDSNSKDRMWLKTAKMYLSRIR